MCRVLRVDAKQVCGHLETTTPLELIDDDVVPSELKKKGLQIHSRQKESLLCFVLMVEGSITAGKKHHHRNDVESCWGDSSSSFSISTGAVFGLLVDLSQRVMTLTNDLLFNSIPPAARQTDSSSRVVWALFIGLQFYHIYVYVCVYICILFFPFRLLGGPSYLNSHLFYILYKGRHVSRFSAHIKPQSRTQLTLNRWFIGRKKS